MPGKDPHTLAWKKTATIPRERGVNSAPFHTHILPSPTRNTLTGEHACRQESKATKGKYYCPPQLPGASSGTARVSDGHKPRPLGSTKHEPC